MKSNTITEQLEKAIEAMQEDIEKIIDRYPDNREELVSISDNMGIVNMLVADALGITTKEEQEDMQEQSTEDKNPYQLGVDRELIFGMEQIFAALKPNEARSFLEEMFENWLPDCSEHGESIQEKYSFIRANISFLEQMYSKYNFKSIFN